MSKIAQRTIMAAVLATAFAGPAAAEKLASISASLAATNVNGFGTIHVVSTDGQSWSKIKPGRLDLQGHLAARMSTGFITSYHMRLGACGSTAQCAPFPIIYGPFEPDSAVVGIKRISGDVHFSMDPSIAGLSTANAIGLQMSFDTIVSRCNMNRGRIRQGHSFNATFKATFGLDTGNWQPSGFDDSGGTEVDFRKVIDVPVLVECDPAPIGPGDMAQPEAPFRVTKADLFLATFKGDASIPSQGASCKVLRVTARFRTNKAGLVHFNLSHKVGDAPLATVPITAEAKQRPDGGFAAEYVKDWFLDKATYAQFMVQETDGGGVSAGWKDIHVVCGGDFADPASQPPTDQADLKVLKSSFRVTTYKGQSPGGCPANAALDVEFITNKPGGVPFRVTGTDGFVWNFSIRAEESMGPLLIGQGQAQFARTYRAKYRRMIPVAKTTHATYRLEVRNVATLPAAKHAGPDNLDVACGGGLTTAFQVTSTKIDIVRLSGQACPTKAFANVAFTTNGPGNVRYRIAATSGEVATGSAPAKKVGKAFIAKHVMTVDIRKGGPVTFSGMPLDFPKKAALLKKQFACAGPKPGNLDLSGSKPGKNPAKPGRKVVVPAIVTPKPGGPAVTPPKLACLGGRLRGAQCVCPPAFKAVKVSATVFRCARGQVPGLKAQPGKPPPGFRKPAPAVR